MTSPATEFIAREMYSQIRENSPRKAHMPETLEEIEPASQSRYIELAQAAVDAGATLTTPAAMVKLLNGFAWELVWRWHNPMTFAETIRDVFEEYERIVSREEMPPEVVQFIDSTLA